ncbi:MAG: hypothetical protein HY875_11580 [Chloroflexi bacterium]|nr:hypothetical protein [Chloroflexota bacterium]
MAVAPDEPELNDGVVVAASTSLTPEECAELAGQGKPVIVLAPLPTKSERNRYLSAGARGYLPMSLDLIPLVVLIESVLHRV